MAVSRLKIADQPQRIKEAPEIVASTTTLNALAHLYRAEVGRLTSYRVRLDTTTSWAITTSALVSTFTLGNNQISHAALLFLMLLLWFFLQLEARRYRAYEASRHRVQLFECYFYPQVLGEEVDETWPRQLVEALEHPGLTVNRLGAIGWRARRSYIWLFGAVVLAWLTKVHFETRGADLAGFVGGAHIGPVRGEAIFAAVGLAFLAIAALAFGARRIYPGGADDAWSHMEDEPD